MLLELLQRFTPSSLFSGGDTTACHPALQLPEILAAIFDNFDPSSDRNDCRTCVNAARVCHSLSEPASSAVWRSMVNLSPLWAILYPGKSSNAWRLGHRVMRVNIDPVRTVTVVIKYNIHININRYSLHKATRMKKNGLGSSYVPLESSTSVVLLDSVTLSPISSLHWCSTTAARLSFHPFRHSIG